MRCRAFLAVATALTACGPAPPGAAPPPPVPVSDAPAATANSEPPAATPSAGLFNIVAVTSFLDRLMAFDDVPIAVAFSGRFMPLYAGRAPALDERLFAGLPGPYTIRGVAGRLDSAGAVATDFDPFVEGGGAGLYRRTKGSGPWLPQPFQFQFKYVGSGRWHGGRHLALSVTSGYGRSAPFYRFEVISGPAAPTPEPQLVDDAPALVGPSRGLAVYPDHLIVRPSGEVLTIGRRQGGNAMSSGTYVERFALPDLASSIEALPKPADAIGCAVAGWADTGDSLWLACSETPDERHARAGFLMEYRNGTWRHAQLPPGAAMPRASLGMSVGPDGSVWLAASGLLRRSEGVWHKVELPKYQGARIEAIAVLADAPGSVWVVGRAGELALVLHTQPIARSAPPRWDFMDDRLHCAYPSLTLTDRKPASDKCIELFVVLRELAQPAFEPSAVADIVGALRGQAELGKARQHPIPCLWNEPRKDRMRLVRFVEAGKSYFGAHVPLKKMADRVVELVKAGVPGSAPEALCYRPDADAELVVDLATGSITGWADPVPTNHTPTTPLR